MVPTIRLTDVRRRFGKLQALDGLSLEVRPGEIYGFLGRNGAGKTTTLRVLMGILRADSGVIELFGERVKQITVGLKQRIGYVSQEQNFYPWMTARQLGWFVSGFYKEWDEVEFRALLKSLDVPEDRRASELSGGTRAKLGLCLAFAPRPSLVLLDEPTAGLDPVARREFNDLLVEIVRDRGTTAFFSSHIVAEVEQVANRVGIIQAGRMKFEGEVTALLQTVRQVRSAPKAFATESRGGDQDLSTPSVASSGTEASSRAESREGDPEPSPSTLTPSGTEASSRAESREGDLDPAESSQTTRASRHSTSLGMSALEDVTVGFVDARPSTPLGMSAPDEGSAGIDSRAVSFPADLPPGFTQLRGDVLLADPALWESTRWPEGTEVLRLTLEDAFLAFARTDVARTRT